MSDEAIPEAGWVSPGLREELPGLTLRYLVVERGSGRTPSHVKDRLAQMSNRFSGPQAINLRHQPIPWAYRVFYRQIGLDPDEQRTPVEAVALERIRKGGFVSAPRGDSGFARPRRGRASRAGPPSCRPARS